MPPCPPPKVVVTTRPTPTRLLPFFIRGVAVAGVAAFALVVLRDRGWDEARRAPSVFVLVVRVKLPEALAMTTSAPATAAPDLSVTVPLI